MLKPNDAIGAASPELSNMGTKLFERIEALTQKLEKLTPDAPTPVVARTCCAMLEALQQAPVYRNSENPEHTKSIEVGMKGMLERSLPHTDLHQSLVVETNKMLELFRPKGAPGYGRAVGRTGDTLVMKLLLLVAEHSKKANGDSSAPNSNITLESAVDRSACHFVCVGAKSGPTQHTAPQVS